MNTLIISYLPRGDRSNTKKILEAFKNKAKGNIKQIELSLTPPELLLQENVAAYYKRNYGGETLNEKERQVVKAMDEMVKQFEEADYVVLAYPMHNFSLPAAVKAYFDSVLQKGQAWDVGETGYVGLFHGRKALVITSSAGKYSQALGNEGWEHSVSLAKVLFNFMGIEPVIINAEGLATPDAGNIIETSAKEAEVIADKWYE